MSRKVPAGSRTVSKLAAAQTQIDAAIDRLYKGDFVSCITLAAAAEGIMSERKGSDLYTYVRNHPEALSRFDQKQWADTLNMEIHYLKHPAPHLPGPLIISRMEAVTVLARAMSKLTASEWTPKMDRAKPAILMAFDEEEKDRKRS